MISLAGIFELIITASRCSTFPSATLPRTTRLKPRRPWVPMTTISAGQASASSAITPEMRRPNTLIYINFSSVSTPAPAVVVTAAFSRTSRPAFTIASKISAVADIPDYTRLIRSHPLHAQVAVDSFNAWQDLWPRVGQARRCGYHLLPPNWYRFRYRWGVGVVVGNNLDF